MRSPDGPVRQGLKAYFRHPKNVRILICKLRTNETGKAWKHLGRKLTNGRYVLIINHIGWLVISSISMQLMSPISFGRVAAILRKNIFTKPFQKI